jgi:hypothetical protein
MSVCVFVYSCLSYAASFMRCIVLSSVACLAVPFFPTGLINGKIFGNKFVEHKI